MKSFLVKLLSVGALVVALLVALSMVEGVIAERRGRQAEVEGNIAETAARQQTVVGPLLVVPYRLKVTTHEAGKDGQQVPVVREEERRAVFAPESLEASGRADVTPRRRGLYRALLYAFDGRFQAAFHVPARLGLDAPAESITAGRPYLAIGLSDVRGLQSEPVIRIGDAVLKPEQGTAYEPLGSGIHAVLGPLDLGQAHTFTVSVALDLIGMNSLSVTPVGKTTTFTLDSPWPHPSSIGRFLPRAKAEGEGYFPARWSVSHLATNAATALIQGTADPKASADTFGVAFIEPVDVYVQSERAVKYGLLFVVLTFAGFYLFEILKTLRIHPLQYGFVGLALTVFFLLLVSLSEHMPFASAYAVASVACVALVAYYLSFVLNGWRRGAAFGAKLATLYAVLYGLLRSEDNALVMGAILLFLVLAGVMIVTRRVDWYGLTGPGETHGEAV